MSDYFTEIFPLTSIPELTTYLLEIDDIAGELNTIGGKLSFALKSKFNGNWAYSQNYILTDIQTISLEKLQEAINEIRSNQPDTYRSLKSITISDWKPNPQAQADFMSRLLSTSLLSQAESVLPPQDLSNVYIKRELEIRGWDIQGQPALSISVSSALFYKQDLSEFVKKLKDPKDVEGLKIRSKNKNPLKGIIIQSSGTLKEHRERLISISKTDASKTALKNAHDDEIVFWVEATSRSRYQYIASQLHVIVEPKFYRLLAINGSDVRKNTTLSPSFRSSLIKKASKIFKDAGYIVSSPKSMYHVKLEFSDYACWQRHQV